MPVNPTLTLEMDFGRAILDAEGNAILDAQDHAILDTDWNSEVIADARASVPFHIRRGNFGGAITDRVADTGTMNFALDNSENNSQQTLGLYSPSNDNCRNGFDESTLVRLLVEYGAYSRYKFQGVRLNLIDPVSGQYGSRITPVTAVDWMDEAARTPAAGLELQASVRDDQLLLALLDIITNQPDDYDFSVGPDTYALAFADVQSESDTVLSLFQSTMLSGLGKLFAVGNGTTGEHLKYLTRHDILAKTTPVAILDDSMIEMQAPRKGLSRIRKVVGITHPVTEDSAATTVLFSTTTEYQINAGESITFTGHYRDPSGGYRRIVGLDFVDPLVAGTDYNFSSATGSGSDLNGDLAVTISPHADACDFTFTNIADVTGYLQKGAQIRGKGAYRYEPVYYTAEDTEIIKGESLNFDMPYQDSYNTGKNLTDLVLVWESVEKNERPVVHFVANRNADLMAAFIEVEPTDLVSITETVTGINKNYLVDGVEYDIQKKGRRIDVYWYCTPMPEGAGSNFCILNRVGSAELNTTAILAP